jgi:hypothetical protein
MQAIKSAVIETGDPRSKNEKSCLEIKNNPNTALVGI